MIFKTANELEMLAWQLRQADYVRAFNRARINRLFNGYPPYSEKEVEENNVNVNVNDLSSTRLAHDARAQFYQAFLKPGAYFTCTSDYGPEHKRSERNAIVTKEINRIMKRSLHYFECMRSKFALNVLHGISPAVFRDKQRWCPEPMGVEDVLVPANTLLTMYNLPFFLVYRSFTAPELIRLTQGPRVDPGWNKRLARACIKWVDEQTGKLMTNNWPEIWSPEKAQERIKGSSGSFYMGDAVPTVNVWDCYFWNDDKKVQGWNRRMVIDAWSTPDLANAVENKMTLTVRDGMEKLRGQFLYDPGERIFARQRSEIINWQFADLSAVAPFRYHSVRSLGYLMYAICHLQNRMRCKFNEAVFEQLMVLFRVKGADDMQRALKVDMINKGFVDETLDFIKAQDRYQVNVQLAELGLRENNTLITQNASSYSPQVNDPNANRVEKTKFQVMTETQAVTSLVSAALLQAYFYQNSEYREIFRRFCIKNSVDPDVREFQARCLRQGVPEKMLRPECWETEPERVMGAGNKTLEMSIVQQLMQWRPMYDSEAQRQILFDATLAATDDPARAEALVPDNPDKVTDAKFAASLAAGTLLKGLPVAVKSGINHIDYVETLLRDLAMVVKRYQKQVPPPDDIVGMQNMAQHIAMHIQIIAQIPEEKQRVKMYNDALGKLMNEVKGYAQRFVQQQQQAQAQNGGDPEIAAKLESIKLLADAKAANTRESHAQRTAQREIQFQIDTRQKQEQHRLDLAQEAQEMEMERRQKEQDLAHEAMLARQELVINEAKGAQEVRHAEAKAKAAANKPKPKSS